MVCLQQTSEFCFFGCGHSDTPRSCCASRPTYFILRSIVYGQFVGNNYRRSIAAWSAVFLSHTESRNTSLFVVAHIVTSVHTNFTMFSLSASCSGLGVGAVINNLGHRFRCVGIVGSTGFWATCLLSSVVRELWQLGHSTGTFGVNDGGCR